ncbi:MAG TPA: M20/M25/M40 family metallo-hydrolase [Steroidobacteraceae bacterium]|nr:M20/M25/M40 family metallo-hydrolase [Steroidobacteraceae bacterium]
MSKTVQLKVAAAALATLCITGIGHAQTTRPGADEAAFRALYKELIEINTTRSVGNCTQAAEAMRKRLLAAGLPPEDLQILAPPEAPNDGALIAVLRGTDKSAKPILLLAHIDVVEAKREDWQRDPFKLVEENGWFYARGASDDKAMAAIFTDSLIRYKQEGYRPRRDLKLALTCGEETAGAGLFDSVRWLVQTRPEVLSAAFAINEGAGGEYDKNGRAIALQIQAGEKVYQDFALEAVDPGGHSSRPTPSNAIVRMSSALAKLGAYDFPIGLNTVTRSYFEAMSNLVEPEVAADMRAVLKSPPDEAAAARLWSKDPSWNAMLRTTCIVSMIEGGHAPNALPQRVRANVNCRILPGTPVADVQAQIVKVIADDAITVSPNGEGGVQSPMPPLTEAIVGPARKVAEKIWPGVVIVPTMLPGYTDGKYLNPAGVPTYGLSGLFEDAEGNYIHGLNERMRVKSLMEGRRFLYEVVKLYADSK